VHSNAFRWRGASRLVRCHDCDEPLDLAGESRAVKADGESHGFTRRERFFVERMRETATDAVTKNTTANATKPPTLAAKRRSASYQPAGISAGASFEHATGILEFGILRSFFKAP